MNEHETEANALKLLLSSVCLRAMLCEYDEAFSCTREKYATWEFV